MMQVYGEKVGSLFVIEGLGAPPSTEKCGIIVVIFETVTNPARLN